MNIEEKLASHKAPRIIPEQLAQNIKEVVFVRPTGTLTICVITMVNGYTVTGESACASPENYDQEVGEYYARLAAERKMWPVLGYMLKEDLFRTQKLLDERVVGESADTEVYVGTKVINAKPMKRADYVLFRGWALPANENGEDEGYLVEYTDKAEGNTAAYQGYVSWSPKDVFERAYKKV